MELYRSDLVSKTVLDLRDAHNVGDLEGREEFLDAFTGFNKGLSRRSLSALRINGLSFHHLCEAFVAGDIISSSSEWHADAIRVSDCDYFFVASKRGLSNSDGGFIRLINLDGIVLPERMADAVSGMFPNYEGTIRSYAAYAEYLNDQCRKPAKVVA